ncbi:MAG: hypothetical protein HKM05_05650 [Spirochaetales bacterium]|nr:hypothetical protein [Spirochaetales bacterium]
MRHDYRGARWWLVGLAFVFGGCWGSGPADTATNYLTSLSQHHFSSAAAFVSTQGQPLLYNIAASFRQLSPSEQAKFTVKNWKIDSVEQAGDTASVDFSYDATPQGSGRMKATLLLIRVKGVWKVDLKRSP